MHVTVCTGNSIWTSWWEDIGMSLIHHARRTSTLNYTKLHFICYKQWLIWRPISIIYYTPDRRLVDFLIMLLFMMCFTDEFTVYQLSIKNVKVAARETISIYRLNDWITKWQVKWSSCREPNSNLTYAVVDPKEIITNQEKDLHVRMDSFIEIPALAQ